MHTALDCKKILTTDGYLINKTEHQRKSLKAEIYSHLSAMGWKNCF